MDCVGAEESADERMSGWVDGAPSSVSEKSK